MQGTPENRMDRGVENMKRILLTLQTVGVAIILATCTCSVSPLAGGNSSQTGNNGIVVSALSHSVSGSTHPGTRLSLYSDQYRPYQTAPGFSDSTIADDSGSFVFTITPDGYYNLVAQDEASGGMAFVPRIPVFEDTVFADTIDTLRRPGFLQGTATDTAGRIFTLSYVYITGSPFYTVTKNDGTFLLGPLPSGRFEIGIIGNFQLVNAQTGQMAPLLSMVVDTANVTVYPDSIAQWQR
jgi:hypothetical protein